MYPSLPVLSAAQMRRCDEYTIRDLHIPSRTLMERAARKVGDVLLSRTDLFPKGQVLVLCGGGNNGGDGLALARFLSSGTLGATRPVVVLYLGRLTADGQPDRARMSEECAGQYELATWAGLPILTLAAPEVSVDSLLAASAVIVDAVLGIGLDRPVTGELAELFHKINDTTRPDGRCLPVLAVDIPSGVSSDTGKVMGTALRARLTVTMQSLKTGLLLYPGAALCGKVVVADLGISLSPVPSPARLVGQDDLTAVLPPRERRTHKGTYGRLGLLCGSRGMAGAAVLATSAALRCGVGLAQVVTHEDNRVILQTSLPEALLSMYNDTPCLRTADPRPTFDGLVLGCGLGLSDSSEAQLRALLETVGVPAVLDADALTLLARHPALWETPLLSAPDKKIILTPHPAEMSRLCGRPVADILDDLPGTALEFSRAHGVVVVLKDAHTVIATPDGQLYLCVAGNAGMAKGGSGDVLAGILGALLTQNRTRLGADLSVGQVAAAGVLLHAMAGDAAAQTLGEISLLASDVVAALPEITRSLSDSRTMPETI